MRIAYLINQYPKVSHTFIRREIAALEARGFHVLRIALRGWEGELPDAQDSKERERTRYVLRDAWPSLFWAVAQTALLVPRRFLSALCMAIRLSRRSARPFPYHFAYLAEACRILPWLKEYGAVHLHAHFGTNSAEVALLVRMLGGPPYSFTVHGPDELDKPEFLGLATKVERAAFVVAISSYTKSQLYRWIAHPEWPKVKVVHCGLERTFFAQPSTTPRSNRLVCVGRICAQKGQLLLLEAAGRLAKKGVDFELVLAGDGELRGDVERVITRLRLGSRVTVTGWLSSDEVRQHIVAARGLVLPSLAEGLPVVLMEAMALGRPVIATSVGGIPELVAPGATGWLLPAGDVDALENAIEELLSLDMKELLAMGNAAHRRALARHSIDKEVAALAQLMGKVDPQTEDVEEAHIQRAVRSSLIR